MSTESHVVLDSITEDDNHRVITTVTVIHRFVLAELNTHRMFSRNSASSRAIPLKKQIERVRTNHAVPVSWPREKPGMQGGEELDPDTRKEAEKIWAFASGLMIGVAEKLGELGVHKSIANRVLEPFMWHTVIITATEDAYQAFFDLRCNLNAQPEIRVAAEAIREAIMRSDPQVLTPGQWHLPYVTNYDEPLLREWLVMNNPFPGNFDEAGKRISAARCARVSYLTHDGVRDPNKDLELAAKLIKPPHNSTPHASPFEHVCTPVEYPNMPIRVQGNLAPHWRQYRHELF